MNKIHACVAVPTRYVHVRVRVTVCVCRRTRSWRAIQQLAERLPRCCIQRQLCWRDLEQRVASDQLWHASEICLSK